MLKREGLLDVLADKIGTSYISDLRKKEFRQRLSECVKEVDESCYLEGEWMDVLDYLTESKPDVHGVGECKKTLLDRLLHM